MIGFDRVDPSLDQVDIAAQRFGSEPFEPVQRDHPGVIIRIRCAVERDDLDHFRQLGPTCTQLAELDFVLGEHDPAPGVGEDVRDIVGNRRGVHGSGGGAGTHDRQVSQDPLVARCRGDRHALLRLDADGHQTGCEAAHCLTGLLPGS